VTGPQPQKGTIGRVSGEGAFSRDPPVRPPAPEAPVRGPKGHELLRLHRIFLPCLPIANSPLSGI